MTYLVNSVFYTIQGEGYWTGRAAVFVRFSRCNLWTGREKDRATAICKFCDTDFTDYRRMKLVDVVDEILDCSGGTTTAPMVVFTGGEPTLQLDEHLLATVGRFGFYTAIETNGTRPVPQGIDWVCVSPKADTSLTQTCGNELKVVWPQPLDLDELADLDFEHFWLSPMDGPDLKLNTKIALGYCLAHPKWRLNIQTHKVIGVP